MARYAERKLTREGIEILLDTPVTSAASDWVELSNGRRIATKTLIWTAGVTPSPLIAATPFQRNRRGQMIVNGLLEAAG